MKFVTVLIHFLSDVFDLLSTRNFATMATWRNDFFLSIRTKPPKETNLCAAEDLFESSLNSLLRY